MKRSFLVSVISVIQVTILFAQIPTDGLIAHYPFNGNAVDETGNGNNGTVFGATLSEDRFGNVDKAYVFDGVDDYIGGVANSSLNVTDQLTISAWIKTDFVQTETIFSYGYSSKAGSQYLLAKAGRYTPFNRIYFIAESELGFFEPDGVQNAGTDTLELGEWHHLLVKYDGSEIYLYVDGKLDFTQYIGDTFKQSTYDYFYIGQPYGGEGTYGDPNFTGLIDDIRIYNRSLTDDEIQGLYHENGFALITDIDDNEYETVTIGNQVWMAENLAYLPSVSPSSGESNTDPYYYVFGYEGTDVEAAKLTENYQTYGVLYNWVAAVNACPSGWHLPSDDEWKELELYIGMDQAEVDREGWRGTTEANLLRTTDGYGFAALEGGYRSKNEHFDYFGKDARWWNSTEFNGTASWNRLLRDTSTRISREPVDKTYGFYVRCLKDQAESSLDDLVAIYPFNGNANDESGNNHHGSVTGAILTVDRFGIQNSAYDFEDWDDYISFSNPPVVNTAEVDGITISHWFSLQSLGSDYNFYSFLNNELAGVISRYRPDYRKLSVSFLTKEFIVDEAMIKDSWYNLVFTADFNDNSAKVYLNGQLKVDSNIDSSRPILNEFHVGRHHLPDGTYGWYYNGNIDDISIYSKAVSSEEVYDLYSESQCYNPIYDTIVTQVFDTTIVTIQDTIITELFDTTYVTINDTVTRAVMDTTFITINDSITTEVFDTTFVMETITETKTVTDTLIIDAVLTGINPPDNLNTLKIYPNPAKEIIFINTGDYTKMNGYRLKITNELGAVVYETNIEDQLYEVNLSTWAGMGLYFIQVIDSGGRIIDTKKIILQ